MSFRVVWCVHKHALMLLRSRLAVLVLSLSTCVAAAGCGEVDPDDGDENIAIGDGATNEDELVAERQLNGSELPDKTVSLTFDDGPGAKTADLADFLAARGIKATFFINGMRAPGRQAAIDRIVGRGHLLANHTQNHKSLTSLGDGAIVDEVKATDAIIKDAQPGGPWIIRAPFGAWNGKVAGAINDSGMKKYVGSVFWDEGGALTDTAAADWACWGKKVSVQRCGELYLQEIRAKKRGIVLLHDIHDKTVEMVKEVIVPALVGEGYKFVDLAEVPSVKRALGAPPASADQCQSATLGRPVDENVCVQSRSNQKWFRCVDREWRGIAGPNDPACTKTFPL
jgi:peptidoglycan/xylan/chitin deacetylase (PgdA/CDA1 family)